jgi:hypothetical protein
MELRDLLIVEIKLTHSQLKSVQEYCKLNNIEDMDKFISKCYTEGFNLKKYGLLGDDSGKTGFFDEKQVEIEVIREIQVQVPVEVIKYVEVIKEVIVEVPVSNLVDIYDKKEEEVVTNIDKICDKPEPNDKILLLQETLQKLRKELSLKNTRIEDLEKINKQLESIKVEQGAVYLKGSNINEIL